MSGPLLGCKPAPETAEYCHEAEGDDAFSCPFQLMFIRKALADLVRKFNGASHTMLEYVFERELQPAQSLTPLSLPPQRPRCSWLASPLPHGLHDHVPSKNQTRSHLILLRVTFSSFSSFTLPNSSIVAVDWLGPTDDQNRSVDYSVAHEGRVEYIRSWVRKRSAVATSWVGMENVTIYTTRLY